MNFYADNFIDELANPSDNDNHQACMIKITGTQTVDGEQDVVEVTTEADIYKRNQNYYIMYQESELTGFDGCKTIIKYEPTDSRVTLRRIGGADSNLVVEQHKRHQCNYDTGYGSLTIGVFGHGIKSTLHKPKGNITFFYDIDIDASVTSTNSVNIQVLG